MWSFFEISSGQKSNLSVAFAGKRLSTRSEQREASLWCTCNPVASSPNKGVSLLVRWLKAKKARTSGCLRQENDMHLTMEMWTSGHPRPCHAWTVTSHGIGAHEENGEPAKLMEANGRVAPTPFCCCQAKYLCERQLNQLWECVFFAGAFVAAQQRAAITPANQLGATLWQPENGSSVNMDHPCLAVQQEVIGDGQMSWRLNLHRLTSQICQTLPVPGTWHLSFDPPPPPLPLSFPRSLSLSLSLSLLALNDYHINNYLNDH